MSVTIDPTIRIKLNTDTEQKLRQLDVLPNGPKESDRGLDLRHVRQVFDNLKQLRDGGDQANVRFHELLASSEMVIPEPVFPERNAELEARIQRLKMEQENREYKQMTKEISDSGSGRLLDEPIAKQLKELNGYIILILQFIISIVASFASGYLAPYYLAGITDVGRCIIIGTLLAFIVAIAELYFIIRHLLSKEGVIDVAKARDKFD